MTNDADRAGSRSMDDEEFDALLEESGLGEADLLHARMSLSPEALGLLDSRLRAGTRRKSATDRREALRAMRAEWRRRLQVPRVLDLLVVMLASITAIPLGLLIALLIRCTMGGPVIVRQGRVGLNGEEFDVLKFRTMRDGRYDDEPDAPRITRLGALLRQSGLDDLPQLWNIARGDMAVVGPCPTLPEHVVHYSPRQRGRLAVRPGLTGWAQVRGRGSVTWPERIELDLWYIANRSLLLDLRILTLTAKALLRPATTTTSEGVSPGFPAPVREADPVVPQVVPWHDITLKQQKEEAAEA